MKNFQCGVGAQVRFYITEPGETEPRLVKTIDHNAVGANLIGMLHYISSHDATSVPVDTIELTYATTDVTAATTNDGPTAYGSTGYYLTSTGSWTNSTGASVTITDLRLLNNTTDPATEYGTLTGQTQVVGIGATLTVAWDLRFVQNSSGGTGLELAWFSRICNRFIAATSTAPVSTALFTADNASTAIVAVGDPTSGGGLSSTSVVWTVTATAPAGAATLASVKLYDAEPLLIDTKSGLSETWLAAKTITATITMTWVTV